MLRAVLLASFLVTAVGSAAAAAQFVIVESTSAKLPPGTIVEGAKPLPLAAGERVTLVGEDGSTLRLLGPSSAPPAAGDASSTNNDRGVVQALSRLFVGSAPSASAWGTFRGNETLQGREAANPIEPWAWNVHRSDSICVPTSVEPALWRPDVTSELVVVLLHLSTGREAELAFAAGQQSVPWPKAVPLLDGGEYAVRDVANLWERRLAVRVIPADEAGEVRQIAWMSDAGCLRQARLMMTKLQ